MVESERKAPIKKMNIMVIGDEAVGKTALLTMYEKNKINNKHVKTVGIDKFTTEWINPAGEKYRVFLWDSAGQQNYQTIVQGFFKNADGIIIMFDLTESKTFKSVLQWVASIHNACPESTPKILVGNKCDKPNHVVSAEEVQKIASRFCMPYFETSAKENTNVREMIQQAMEQTYETVLKPKEKSAPVQEKDRPVSLNPTSGKKEKKDSKGCGC